MKAVVKNIKRRERRLNRTRKKVLSLKDRVRLTVFRSNKHVYAQLIDDKKGVTLAAAHEATSEKMNKTQRAEEVGRAIAAAAKDKKIKSVIFDKGSYRYHGRIKALAEAARKEGLVF